MAKEYPFTLFKGGDAKEVKDTLEEARAREQGYTEPYKHQEYPKHLYLAGDRHGADRVVKDKAEEEAARAEGFRMASDPEPKKEGEGEESGHAETKGKKHK